MGIALCTLINRAAAAAPEPERYPIPKWMDELCEESPVISASEWNMLIKIRSMALKKFGVNTSTVDTRKMSRELSTLVNRLQNVVNHLKMCEKSKQNFQYNYPKWRPIRDRNIKNLISMADALKKKKKKTNEDRLFGSFTSLVGGVITLAARSHPVTAVIATGITLFGSVGAYCSSLEEAKFIKETIKDAKAIVDNDRSRFDSMWSWLIDSSKLQASIDEIFQEMYGNKQDWEKATKEINFLLSAYNNQNMNEREQEILIQKVLNAIKVPSQFRGGITDFVTIITTISMLLKHHCSLFEAALSGNRIKSQLIEFTKSLLVALDVYLKMSNSTRVIPKKSIVILSMFLDAVSFMDTSSEIEKGSPSKESDSLIKIANILQKEAYELRRIYNLLHQ